MVEYDLKFTSSPVSDTGAYKLLELPPELCKLVESAVNSTHLTIKGQGNEDAVLCTHSKTYTLRSVVLSNSVLVVTPPPDGGDPSREVVIRDQSNEILELVPSLPRLHQLDSLLKGQEYDEEQEDADIMSGGEGDRLEQRQRFSYEEAQATVQASETELARGLKDRRVLILEGNLRPVTPSYLTTILELLLNYLVSLSLPHNAAPVEKLSSALKREHNIKREVCEQVMSWFGSAVNGRWEVDTTAVVREIGVGLLRPHKDKPIPRWELVMKWRKIVGDTFESIISLDLLSGNYLINLDTLQDPPAPMVTYFPCSYLPTDPAARFTDLFLTRARWKADEIAPYLVDIAIDGKERDKLLLKFTRAVTDADGVWYTARAKYNG